jgi:pyruvate carboxylase subunit A
VRLDTHIYSGYTIPPSYDSMVGKLIVWALDWEGAVKKARRALDEFHIEGVDTNITLHREIVQDQDFTDGIFNTTYLDTKMEKFKLSSAKHIQEEEEKVSHLMRFIEKIKSKAIQARH